MTQLAHLVTTRARFVLLAGVALVAVSAVWGLGVFGHLDQGGFDDKGTDSAKELAREQQLFGNRNVDVVAIYRSKDHVVTDPAFRRDVEQTLAGIPAGTTTSVTTFWQTHDRSMVSTDRHATQVLVSLAGKDQAEVSDNDDRVVPALRDTSLHTQIAGQWAVYRDVNRTVSEDLARAESVSMPIVLVLSLLIFGSVVAALMPVMVGGIAVIGALAVVRLLTTVTEVSVFSINVISLLGMGLAIDYALFVISRYREELATGRSPAEAIRATVQTAGRTVLYSALTVAGALASLLIFPQNFLRSLGYGGVAAVLVAVVAALTVLPAALFLLGRRIDALSVPWSRMPWRRGRPVRVESDHGAWAHVAHGVMRRPVVVMVVIVGGLMLVASPFLGVKWGSVDYRVLPPDSPSHVAATTLARDFGGETSTANILLETSDRRAVSSDAARAADVPGVVAVQPVARNADATLLRAVWRGNSQTQASQDVVTSLRALPGPDGRRVLVGGASAQTVDLLGSIGRHLPWMALTIAAVMVVLLFLAFGSLVLPVKAIAMNLLSISASFGVITWIFADGHLEGLLDYRSNGFLDATQPIFMLAVLVGLSMDYEVFLLSRVREQWDATGDNTLAVATGVQKTGRIITSAALLLGVVIGAFSLSGITFMKMIGIGMLVALLVDATIVRALLVPATMRLLGRWNWWAPAPLARLWARFGVREGGSAPMPEPEVAAPFARRLQDAVR
jgi:RND superfamily putative drug exporter